jgi:phage tail protein X
MAEHADVDKIVALLKKEETEADDLAVIEQLLSANPSVARATPELEGQG